MDEFDELDAIGAIAFGDECEQRMALAFMATRSTRVDPISVAIDRFEVAHNELVDCGTSLAELIASPGFKPELVAA